MNCQISALTSIRRGLGKDPIPFPVNSNSIKATQNVSGGVQAEIKKTTKSYFDRAKGSQSGGVEIFQSQRGPNPEGSTFHKTGGVRIRRGLIVANSEGSQSGGVHILTVRKGPICANPEGYYFIKDLGKRKKD